MSRVASDATLEPQRRSRRRRARHDPTGQPTDQEEIMRESAFGVPDGGMPPQGWVRCRPAQGLRAASVYGRKRIQ
jgi:hypothetical protein